MSAAVSGSSEIDRIDPLPTPVQLISGVKVHVLPLRMRQMFKLLRIVTRGGAQYLPLLRDALMTAASDDAGDAFGTQLLAVAMLALPEAEDQAVEFIQSVVEPADLRRGTDKATKEYNAGIRRVLLDDLENPDLDDLITIIETVINQEKNDLAALGKRLAAMFRAAMKSDPEMVASLKESSEQTTASQEVSHELVTSSHQNMGGPMRSSSTSQSDD